MIVPLVSENRRPSILRLTEEPALYGMVVRERGELVEYVSYRVARARLARPDCRAPQTPGFRTARVSRSTDTARRTSFIASGPGE